MVDRRAHGLHDEHVGAADVLLDLDARLFVLEGAYEGPCQRQTQQVAYLARQSGVRAAGEDHGLAGSMLGWRTRLHGHRQRPRLRTLRTSRAGTPTTSVSGGTSRVTTAPEPVMAPAASVTGATSSVSDPVEASSPITVRLLTPVSLL